MPYAVIDLETTGFSPKRGDRILEVGVVLVDDAGEIEGEWGSLVNPQRDVGPTPDFYQVSAPRRRGS